MGVSDLPVRPPPPPWLRRWVSRVLLSVIAYASQGDRLYFGLTLFVLSVLVGTAIVGVGL